MSGEGSADDSAIDDEDDAPESFIEGVRDAHVRPDGGRTAGDRSRPTTAKRERGRTRSHADATAEADRTRASQRVRARPALDPACPTTPAIRAATATGALTRVGQTTDGRYGTERRVRYTTDDGIARRVGVRACRLPESERDGFADALAGQLHRWTTVSDVEGVVPVLDRGDGDRPWVVTASTGPTLRGRDTPSVSQGLRQAIQLARALAALHDRGVVHAGIDPGSVVFAVDGEDRPEPALHNPGLADVYRRYEDPAAVLDPRYAAPEYFESERGIVDRATDIYGLGVVCFRLLTGVAPIAGSAERIADRVTDDEPLVRPSTVDPRLPAGIDDVIVTATATEKYDRFETAGEFHDALVAVAEDG